MVKVITYGTFDLLHYGHINLLKRAKSLGDYLIVAVTSEGFDKQRGKINVQQSLIDRIDAIRSLGVADQIIVEEYEGQKINDIVKYNVDVFTVGSDWVGKFDYLNQYCKVVYLDRTEGVSSSSIRSNKNSLKTCLVCNSRDLDSNIEDFKAINGVILSSYLTNFDGEQNKLPYFRNMIEDVDAVFFSSPNFNNTALIKEALLMGKNVFCEGITTFLSDEYENLRNIAKQNNCLLIQGNKTYYSTAYNRMCLLVKSGAIGQILTLQSSISFDSDKSKLEASLTQALATSLLPVFQLIGLDFVDAKIQSLCINGKKVFNILLQYPNSSANISIYEGIATEEQLVITGANAFLYLPSQWWKTDYFEIRFKNKLMNRRYFYKYNENSIQPELLAFLKTINSNNYMNISEKINFAIVEFANKIIELYRK